MSRVQIQGLVKKYGSVVAVDGIDLDIQEGEFVALLGPSGCGKTTTLRCVAGLEEITDGRIVIGGNVVSGPGYSMPTERRGLGMVFQSYAIWPHMTVIENIAFGLKLKKMGNAAITEKVREALAMVGLEGYGERGVSQLSGGQQQRVALARAVALEPRVLLFDEPLSNLDAKLREHMRFELRQLQQRLGITSIYVTHDQQEAMVVADRIILMRGGAIDQIGNAVDLYRKPKTLFAAEFVGLANILPAKVVSAEKLTLNVELAPGFVVKCEAHEAHAPGDVVDIIIRPEDIEVRAEAMDGDNMFPAKLRKAYFLGNIADIVVEVFGAELRGQLSPAQIWEADRPVFVRIAPSAIVALKRKL
jgi:ABC-type Fe3+/spermidine/putrescine transport system ATPase subunit